MMSVPFKGCHKVSRRKVGISATYPARILSGQTTVMCVVVQNRVERKLNMVCEDRWRKEKSHRKPRTVDREPSDHFSPFPPYITACILRPPLADNSRSHNDHPVFAGPVCRLNTTRDACVRRSNRRPIPSVLLDFVVERRFICGSVSNPGAWNEHILSLVVSYSRSGGDQSDRGL